MPRLMCIGLVLAVAASAHATTKYYVHVRGIDEAQGVRSEIVTEATKLFTDELKKHAELTLAWPEGLPADDPDALADALKKRHLKAFEVTLKILDVTRALKPPPPGKQYQVLSRGIKLSVFGDTLPEKKIAIGGDGESRATVEVGKHDDLDQKGKELLIDCARDAITQAVDMTVTKLKLADAPVRLTPKKH
jgi:hypothetical protein